MKKYIHITITLLLCLSFITAVPVAASASLAGDLDGDGTVTTVDSRIVLKIAAGQIAPTSTQLKLADMDGDGIISVSDARLTLLAAIDADSDDVYMQKLVNKGFPKSYVEDLLALHRKYPQWEFEPFITNLDWQSAVNGERTPHKKQLIENTVTSSYKCSCSYCNGVIQESGGWVSASETAVKFYLDPRNFLDEQYIFQFENNVYDGTQSIEAIESILKYTWMYNSNITYYDALGNTKMYTENGKPVKYSEAILKAAKDSGLSAYYIASKIVQEVGGTTPTASAASGKSSPYNGIYNYYNIMASTGAGDGLRYANGYMKTSAYAYMYKTASSSGEFIVTVPQGTELNYIGASGGFYRVSATVSGKKYTGYVAASRVSLSTSYGRPWTDPYKTIYYGAKFIHDGFSDYQFTGYLQKFNVNPASGNLYNHEYMANVRAAAFESYSTYRAYTECNIMETKKVFSIPVFLNMPYADVTKSERFAATSPDVSATSATTTSVTLSWSSVEDATGYQIYKFNTSSSKYEFLKATTSTSYTDTSLSAGADATYLVRAYKTGSDGKYVYSAYSPAFYATASPYAPSGLAKTSVTSSAAAIKWNAVSCTGYYIYRYDAWSGTYSYVGTTTGTTFTNSGLLPGTSYTYKIKAYKKTADMTAESSYSSTVSVTTTGTAPTNIGTANVSDALNIRSEPSTDGDVVVQVSNGQKMYVLATSGEWYKVTFTLNGKTYTGYAHFDYVVLSALKEGCPYAEPTVTLSEGDSGNNVKWLQWYLCKLGYLTTSDIDGSFGPTTLAAVKKFQTDKSLVVDGLVGSGTRSALKSAYGK